MSKLLNRTLHVMGLKKKVNYSNFNEQKIIRSLLGVLPLKNKFCVDVAAGDGLYMSNTYQLFSSGWAGVAVEFDPRSFAKLARRYMGFPEVQLFKTKVTPSNVVNLLRTADAPRDLAFLSLDIDGYDHFVMDALLASFRPFLICAEINEKIPPPIRFTVKFDPGYQWHEDHFYGQSLSMLETLAKKWKYALVGLEYNNAFLVPQEHAKKFKQLSAGEAYQKGYLGKKDRLQKMPWNKDMEDLQKMEPAQAIRVLRKRFKKYEGQYICKL